MAAPRLERRYTPEEYLAYEREAPYKNEYIAGHIVAMRGASRVVARITMNLARILSTQTLDGPCEAYGSDLRVKVGTGRRYTYPDLTVVCGEQQFEYTQGDTLIIEVLSPSTEAYDRGASFGYYRTLPSLQEYVLVAQDQCLSSLLSLRRRWVLVATTDSAAVVSLASIDCDLPVAEVYRKVVFSRPALRPRVLT